MQVQPCKLRTLKDFHTGYMPMAKVFVFRGGLDFLAKDAGPGFSTVVVSPDRHCRSSAE